MRSIVLDSYIEKMVEQFSEDMKKKRQELVEERKGLQWFHIINTKMCNDLRNEFDFWKVHGIMNTSGFLQS